MPEESKWVIVHNPKCAGTTFRMMLFQSLSERQVLKDFRFAASPVRPHPRHRMVIGHFPAAKYSHLLAKGWNLGLMLREPIMRLESHYNFIDQSRHKPRHWLLKEPECLLDFMLDPQFRNSLSKSVAGFVPELKWVGFQESFLDSCERFEDVSGFEMKPIARVWNKRNHREQFSDLPTRDQMRVLDFHKEDIEFYYALLDKHG